LAATQLLQVDVRNPFASVPGSGNLNVDFEVLTQYSTTQQLAIFDPTAKGELIFTFNPGLTAPQLQVTLFCRTNSGTPPLTPDQVKQVVTINQPKMQSALALNVTVGPPNTNTSSAPGFTIFPNFTNFSCELTIGPLKPDDSPAIFLDILAQGSNINLVQFSQAVLLSGS
jgi:hypothetical protein